MTVKPPSRDPNTHKVEEHAPTWTETFMFYDVRKDDELVVKVGARALRAAQVCGLADAQDLAW